MGVEYKGRLCVGYEVGEARDIVAFCVDDDIDFADGLEHTSLERFASHYDASDEDSIFGWSVAKSYDYGYSEVKESQLLQIPRMIAEMEKEFGYRPRVYIMAEGH